MTEQRHVASPLRLHLSLPQRDVRRLIWRHLDRLDREMIRHAQNSQLALRAYRDPVVGEFYRMAVQYNYSTIVVWLHRAYKNARYGAESVDLISALAVDIHVRPHIMMCFVQHFPEYGTRFLEWILDVSIRGNDTDVVQTLLHSYRDLFVGRENGFFLDAAQNGCVHVLALLIETLGIPVPMATQLYIAAFVFGHQNVVRWLVAQRIPWPTLDESREYFSHYFAKDIDFAKWCIERGMPFDGMRCLAHARNHQNMYDVVSWLEERTQFLP